MGVKLGVNDFISNSVPKENIDNQVFALVVKLSQRLADRLVVKSTNHDKNKLDASNVIKVKLGVNRYSILLLVSLFPEISIQQMADLLEVSRTTIDKHLTWLKSKQFLERIGSDRKGAWRVTL